MRSFFLRDIVRISFCLIWHLTYAPIYPYEYRSQHEWFKSVQVIFRYRRFALTPVFTARASVVTLLECMWPTIFCFICFPMAGMAGDIRSLCNISFLLAANNMCYLSLGSVLGMCTQSTPFGMISGTIISQGSILAAGVFTELPSSLQWVRYFSPFYWTMQGVLKSVYRWSDLYDCVVGSGSDVGANLCYIEYDSVIDQFKKRGIHVATFNDPSSDSILTEAIFLVILSVVLNIVMFLRCFFLYYRVNWDEVAPKVERMRMYSRNLS